MTVSCSRAPGEASSPSSSSTWRPNNDGARGRLWINARMRTTLESIHSVYLVFWLTPSEPGALEVEGAWGEDNESDGSATSMDNSLPSSFERQLSIASDLRDSAKWQPIFRWNIYFTTTEELSKATDKIINGPAFSGWPHRKYSMYKPRYLYVNSVERLLNERAIEKSLDKKKAESSD